MTDFDDVVEKWIENGIDDMVKQFNAIVKTGRKKITIKIKRDKGVEVIQLPYEPYTSVLNVWVNGKYIGVISGVLYINPGIK